MSNIAWIKNTSGQTIQLLTGRKDVPVMNLEAEEVFPYSSLVIDWADNINYNKNIIDNYTNSGILAYLFGVSVGPNGSEIVQEPVINFIPTVSTKISVGDSINFLDLTTESPTSWVWTVLDSQQQEVTPTFLNSTSKYSQNPIIQFNNAGIYSIKLETVINSNMYTITKSALINALAENTIKLPIASFENLSDTKLYQGNTVSFVDTSINNPTQFSWLISRAGGTNVNDFEYINGTNKNSQFPIVQFNALGSYTVTLIVSNSAGRSVAYTKSDMLTVSQALPVLDFTYSHSAVSVGASVSFTDLTTSDPISWGWEVFKISGNTSISDYAFIENTSEISQNPVIKFNTSGVYSIRLMARNFTGYGDQAVKFNIITVS